VLRREIAELHDIVAVQVDVGNQTTEMFGRLVADATARLEVVEDALRQLGGGEATATGGSNGSVEIHPRAEKLAASRAPEDPA
jgi:hypothetical protein